MKNYGIKLCLNCESPFQANSSQHVYCSANCRFWSQVLITSIDKCWNWNGPKDKNGYGKFKFDSFGSPTTSPRAAWELIYGPIPKGDSKMDFCILHTCDNPSCVNPHHLWLSNQDANMKDAKEKNRTYHPIGEKNPKTTLSNNQVKLIKKLLSVGIKISVIAKFYDINRAIIYDIKNEKKWAHIKI